MSRPWIKLYTEMLHDPKVGQLSDSAYRLFVELMLKAGQVDEDGATDTVDALAWELRRQSDDLLNLIWELEESGRLVFLDPETQIVYITSWAKRQPPTTSSERVKRHREKVAEQTKQTGNETVTLQQRFGNVLDKEEDKELDPEEEKEIPPNPPQGAKVPAIPPELDTEPFREIWQEWKQHRREKRSGLKPTTAKSQLKSLAAMGEGRAIAALRYSITQGYTGIFEPDPVKVRGPAPATQPKTFDQIRAENNRKATEDFKRLIRQGAGNG